MPQTWVWIVSGPGIAPVVFDTEETAHNFIRDFLEGEGQVPVHRAEFVQGLMTYA